MFASALNHASAMKHRWSLTRAMFHPLALLLLAFACNTCLWALTIPPGSAPDEQAHFEYIQHLALQHTLPVYGQTAFISNPQALNPQAMQPPLFYLLAAPLALLLQNQPVVWQYIGLRALSILLSATTVALSYALGRAIAPKGPEFALVVATLIAFNPMFTYMSAAINNDNFANLIYAALLLMFGRGLQQQHVSRAWLVGAGALLGIGLLAKFSMLTGCLLSVVVIAWLAWRLPQQRIQTCIRYSLWMGGTALLLSGWLLVRNWLLYGDPTTLLIFSKYPELYPAHGYNETGSLWQMLTTSHAPYINFWHGLLYGFWGIFDFYTIWMSQRYYLAFTILLLGGLAGSLLAGALAWRQRHDAETRQRLLFGGVCALLTMLVLWSNISRSYQIDYQPQGRYLFPALVPLALAVVVGWQRLAWTEALRKLVMVALVALVLAANLLALFTAVMPIYHDQHARNVLAQSQNSAQGIYGSFAATNDLIAQQPTIMYLDVLLDVPRQIKQPIILRIQRVDAPQELATAIIARPGAGLVRYRIDVSQIDFMPGARYQLNIQAPWATADRAVIASFSAARASNIASQVVYPFNVSQQTVEHISALLRTADAGSLQGILQQVLCVCVVLLMIGFVVVFGRMLGSAGWSIMSACAPLLMLILLSGPLLSVPNQIVIPTQEIVAMPGPLLTRSDQDSQFADLILLSGSMKAQKNPPDDPAQQLSIIQPYRFTINDDTRAVLTMQPPSAITYTLSLPEHAMLKTALALNPEIWQPDKGDGVVFVVEACTARGCHELLRQEIDPKHRAEDRRWHDVTVDLHEFGGQTVQLVLRTLPGPAGDASYDWAGWGEPVIVPHS